jgi:hypothetical protein
MNEMQLLIQTLTALNIHHVVRQTDDGADVWLEESQQSMRDQTTVPYKGYLRFAWVFCFDSDGKLQTVGGYE